MKLFYTFYEIYFIAQRIKLSKYFFKLKVITFFIKNKNIFTYERKIIPSHLYATKSKLNMCQIEQGINFNSNT